MVQQAYYWLLILLGVSGYTCGQLFEHKHEGKFPVIFNLATEADITSNATCGETGPETYCKLVEHVKQLMMKNYQCGICDANGDLPYQRHPIQNAIDGSNRWWQSPSLANGWQYDWVTITLDLGQAFQIAYVIVKAANSPRPANWILERSVDGITFTPWQYFALSDGECWNAFGVPPTVGRPRYRRDDEVICTSFYSRLDPIENGEIHTSLVNGRPGAVNGPSDLLLEFTTARFLRLRLQKIRTLNADLMTIRTSNPDKIDKAVTRRYFYSIKDISIGGQCKCYGHASSCPRSPDTGKLMCVCEDNTCGKNCEKCCPKFNQQPYKPGTYRQRSLCEECQCFGHSDECYYNQTVADNRQSQNIAGEKNGGGVCMNCRDHTTGVNCEQCEAGYYRTTDDPREPCQPCQCSQLGSTGTCVQDNSRRGEGLMPGDCICRVGFGGRNCDRCASGYKNFPSCIPCPCSRAGSRNVDTCQGDCICKPNVVGENCDQCKPGFFNMEASNPAGCMQCFCFGISQNCRSAGWGQSQISSLEGWRVTDLRGKKYVVPSLENGRLTVDHDNTEVAGLNPVYYWHAPAPYAGSKLASYGGNLTYSMYYVVQRLEDVNTAYTADLDVIMEGNELLIGYGGRYYREGLENTMQVFLTERDWYHVDPDTGLPKQQIVTRQEFMTVLANIERLLIRASYHIHQTQIQFLDMAMDVAVENSTSPSIMSSVEQCFCPRGYSGLSCELTETGEKHIGNMSQVCERGHRRVNDVLYGGICEQCNCNNHADTCEASSGLCTSCRDNTVGPHCENCEFGYYGNATRGTPNDCRPCACPLAISTNNFASNCMAAPPGSQEEYFCVSCPDGYIGNHCEMCDDGYFGNPLVPGNYCQPCACSGNINPNAVGNCDRTTGQCLKCLFNTEGWNCAQCKPDYYGMVYGKGCKECDCNQYGSTGTSCDQRSGQCSCRPYYEGRACDSCVAGYGNIIAGCPRCSCNLTGSVSNLCDQVSGQCPCKNGVGGQYCGSCLPDHWEYSEEGCKACNCHLKGSNDSQCDLVTGTCTCQPNVIGDKCDQCEINYYDLDSGNGCQSCDCDVTGSTSLQCGMTSGQCPCKPGVTGQKCDQCRPGYYGFSSNGCTECPVCPVAGQVCDAVTGECVCPTNTEGDRCERCVPDTWGHDQLLGCKQCNCNMTGSLDTQCDTVDGQCECRPEYDGMKCDMCRFGHFGFPNCRPCHCNENGTVMSDCNAKGHCQCQEDGQCPCRGNVEGLKCKHCKEGSFSLQSNNPEGCTSCFCFGKSNICEQAQLTWNMTEMPTRSVRVQLDGVSVTTIEPALHVIPPDADAIFVTSPDEERPLYWSAPRKFLGDKTLSYYGKLKFVIYFEDQDSLNTLPIPIVDHSEYRRFPLVRITGNFRVVLDYFAPLTPGVENEFEIFLREDQWTDPLQPSKPVTREMLMVGLQNLQSIKIRASGNSNLKYAEIRGLSLQHATNASAGEAALGVERCQCPPEYAGHSCQDPAPGYFRFFPSSNLEEPELIKLLGISKPCECHGHSDMCNKETGVCLNCAHNTAGDHCNTCAEGYYGNATSGREDACQPCGCPRLEPQNNFSPTCVTNATADGYVCNACPRGYEGDHCERCSDYFYGDPTKLGGECVPCDCSEDGSLDNLCDRESGQCICHPGVLGRACDQCQPRYAVVNGRCKSCDVGCTRDLMVAVDEMEVMVRGVNTSTMVVIPWERFFAMENKTQVLRGKLDAIRKVKVGDMEVIVKELQANATKLYTQTSSMANDAMGYSMVASNLSKTADGMEKEIREIITSARDLLDNLPDVHQLSGNVNLTSVMMKAQDIMKMIRERDFKPNIENADNELELAKALKSSISDLQSKLTNVTDAAISIQELADRLNDLISLAEQSAKDSRAALELNQKNDELIKKLQNMTQALQTRALAVSSMLNMSSEMLKEANMTLPNSSAEFLRDLLEQLKKDTENLTIAAGLLRQNLPNLEPKVRQAEELAEKLRMQADNLDNMFQGARATSEDAVKAAQVYEGIVVAVDDALKEAQSAHDLASEAMNKTTTADGSTLQEKAKKSANTSLDFVNEANRLVNSSKDLKDLLGSIDKDIDQANKRMDEVDSAKERLTEGMDRLPAGIHEKLIEANDNATGALEKAMNTVTSVDSIQEGLDNDLKPKLDVVKVNTKELQDLETMTGTMMEINNNLDGIRDVNRSIHTTLGALNRLNMSLSQSLEELRESIQKAREQANNIKVSLAAGGSCHREYRTEELKPSTTNTISFNFKTNNTEKDMLLFYVQGEEKPEFMAVEIVERKLRFVWNSGGGVAMANHSLQIESEETSIQPDEKWYSVIARRTANVGTLAVQKIKFAGNDDPALASSSSSAQFTKLDLNDRAKLYVAGAPQGTVERDPALKGGMFVGCIADVTLDGRVIGLHNFNQSFGECGMCTESPTPVAPKDISQFDGTGYAEVPPIQRYDSTGYLALFEFRTFWEDALLFFSGNKANGEYIAVELVNGKVVFSVNFGGGNNISIESREKYNTNQWMTVKAETQGNAGQLEVTTSEGREELKRAQATASGEDSLDISNASVYFGGIPSTSKFDSFPLSVRTPFLGCMKGIQVTAGGNALPLYKGLSIGMTLGCRENKTRVAGFHGDGYIQLTGDSLPGREADISFSFRSLQDIALLLLGLGGQADPHFYSVSLIDGKLQAKFDAGDGEVTITSDDTFNDGMLHGVSIIRNRRKLDMFVDDLPVGTERLSKGSKVEISSLYLGGVPADLDIASASATSQPLQGCIRDLVLNGKLVQLDQPVSYQRADIGRCSENIFSLPLPNVTTTTSTTSATTKPIPIKDTTTTTVSTTTTMSTSTTTMSTTTAEPEECAYEPEPEIEPEAAAFGDVRNSHSEILVDRDEISSNFDIMLEFRTYYPNGLLVYLSNEDQSEYVAIQMAGGTVMTSYADQKTGVPVNLTEGATVLVDDGKWHKIRLMKSANNIIFKVDEGPDIVGRIANKIDVLAPMYVGGLPRGYNMRMGLVPDSLKGCVRGFRLNSQKVDLIQSKAIMGVSTCNKYYEKGVYFSGYAYGIYDSNFVVGSNFLLTFDFRTTKPEGVILTISHPYRRPSMALELFDGQLQFTVNNEDGLIFSMTEYENPFRLCNNKWHTVRAELVKNTIMLTVDGVEQLSETGGSEFLATDHPLFIGGYPYYAEPQGAAQANEKFQGCIRNMKINGAEVDWSSSKVLTVDVKIGYCPGTK
ncbi:laminin subunit alpha-2 isoform X2 [Lingula anatina]|uniref:Laminin subunit alpha-2 isoform X2 n=1 Tax=Lingula anatina TaxID=7574 RepID=A0A1S3IFM7_LINAN|nr:laminin subunit alpha-2 isoform X2 [Lingula anatina]|eukprot:XP_013397032.1 laminin subunit alpha-2 isoform X2 [Lingula anatina]